MELELLSGVGKNVASKTREVDEVSDVNVISVDNISIKSSVKSGVDEVLPGSQNEHQRVLSSTSVVVEREIGSNKRKRESPVSFAPMLEWLANIAKNPKDPDVGKIPASSKWENYGSKELWKQALMAREALMIKRNVDSGIEGSLLQNKVRMHPSMYENDNILNGQYSEQIRSRSSKRRPLVKPSLCSCCKSPSPCKKEVKTKKKVKPSKEHKPITVKASTIKMQTIASFDKPRQKQISVGLRFQAEVPAWTGVVIEDDDSRWLGTQMWPQKDEQTDVSETTDAIIGKGRESLCLCCLPGSIDCVRFHIAERRIKLSLELGPLFYKWKFNHMGEEVSLSWTMEDEKKFKNMATATSKTISKFWKNAFKLFPNKNREKLVSYYFNVHVIRKRCYQNRVTPNEIDSDDEVKEVESLGDNFGYEKVHVPRITYSQNS